MFCFGHRDVWYKKCCAARKQALQQVKEKYPNLLEGSSGWYRAVENRYKRILKNV